ncbi:hypothetical protein [Paenibacillus shenyangensis]|uniref:hypothetical protein n=1 Tax=Paenibacillus sp. A9 TaxID=1284352 RepID=UPI00036A36D2|nr:hypothetical protein [Paenibacillus sp. A9]
MMKYNSIRAFAGLIILMMCVSACSAETHTETFVMSSGNEVTSVEQSSRPFQIHKIYRLPEALTNTVRLLGWSSSDSVVVADRDISVLDQGNVKRLVRPYEQSKPISGLPYVNSHSTLSPNGKYISSTSSTTTKSRLKLINLQDGTEKEIASFNASDSYIQYISWSNNSAYLSYLVERINGLQPDYLYIYDMKTQTSKKYELTKSRQGDTLLNVMISNDGRSVLLQTIRKNEQQRITLIAGKVSGRSVDIQYERVVGGGEQTTWLSNDQFVFLGVDGTLYEYDQRNGELSVLLEKILTFKFSPDRKNIAYTTYDEQTVTYVGKLQGRNILYNEAVYHGILLNDMYWSPDNQSLLIQGQKLFDPSLSTSTESVTKEAFVIELK